MAKYLTPRSGVLSQLRMLGKLAAYLESDPRNPCEVMADFFALDDQERRILLDSYDGDDRIDAVVR